MALDYFIYVEEDLDTASVIEKIDEHSPLNITLRTSEGLRAKDKAGTFYLSLRKKALPDRTNLRDLVDYPSRTIAVVRLDKEKRNDGKTQLARIAQSFLEITSSSVT